MIETIITDIEKLSIPSSQIEFLSDGKIDVEAYAEITEIISKLKDTLAADEHLMSLTASQIGIQKRIFCIKSPGGIDTFINPILTKKSDAKFINYEPYIDNKSHVYVLRPNEITAVFYTDGFNYESKTFKDPAKAAAFMANYNLLDGIIPTRALSIDADSISKSDIITISDAAYSGSGILATEEDSNLEEIAQTLSLNAEAFSWHMENLCENCEDTELKAVAREFRLYERIALGIATIIDTRNLNKQLKNIRKAEKGERRANFKHFAENKCRR